MDHLVEEHPLQNAPGQDLEHDDFHPPLGKRIAPQRRRKAQETEDLHRGGAFGIDGHAQPQLGAQEPELFGVFGAADARDGVRCPELAGEDAAQKVDLVCRGGGDEQIRRLDPRLLLRL